MEWVNSYSEISAIAGRGERHVLLGNGFSVECDPVFRYSSLYQSAVDAGLSAQAQRLFDRLGTNNFEGALRLVDDARWVAREYGVTATVLDAMESDSGIVKRALVGAVTASHLAHIGQIEDARKEAARQFLAPYHNIFTTNYDLLPYWVNMHGGGPIHQDGFRSDEEDPDAPYVVFAERLGSNKGLFYLHGALHFFLCDGELRKHCWSRTGQRLTDLIQEGLARGDYPLFVAEGTPAKKLEQIQRVGYLWYALDKFSRIRSPLVVFGHALGPSDAHIADAVADNLDLTQLFVGLHGDPADAANQAIQRTLEQMIARRLARVGGRRRRKDGNLTVYLYPSESAEPWG